MAKMWFFLPNENYFGRRFRPLREGNFVRKILWFCFSLTLLCCTEDEVSNPVIAKPPAITDSKQPVDKIDSAYFPIEPFLTWKYRKAITGDFAGIRMEPKNFGFTIRSPQILDSLTLVRVVNINSALRAIEWVK